MAFYGGEYATTGAATNITTALAITQNERKACRQIILRTTTGAGVNYYGAANVTLLANRAGQLLGADLAPVVLGGGDAHPINTDFVYLIGDGSIVHITLVT